VTVVAHASLQSGESAERGRAAPEWPGDDDLVFPVGSPIMPETLRRRVLKPIASPTATLTADFLLAMT
jgi:hypothetical protein